MHSGTDGWGAPAWLRGVFAAARGGSTGSFALRATSGESFQIVLRRGRPVAIRSSVRQSPKLGELLARQGKRDLRDTLADWSDDGEPIGRWLLTRGYCSQEELCAALRLQMSLRFEGMFRQRTGEGSFYVGNVPESTDVEPETFASLCMRTARRMGLRADHWQGIPLKVSFVGRQLLGSYALAPAERACLEVVARKPVTREQLRNVLGDAPMVVSAISSLFWLGAFERCRRGHGSYLSLLQQKRWARAKSLDSILSAEERRRRIGAAHPDRFASDPSPAIKQASEEALRALLARR